MLSVLSTLGVGGIVATHSVYLSEMTSPEVRNRVLLTSQGVTALVAVGVNLLAFAWIPSNWQLFLWVSAAIEVVMLLPLLYWKLPESPRWLEAHGRHEEAEQVMTLYEQRCQAASAAPLPAPNPVLDQVISAEGRIVDRTVHQPAVSQPHLAADFRLAAGLCRADLRRGAFAAVLHGGSWRARRISCS